VIDLDGLAALTGIGPDSAEPLVFRCAIALQRRHRPGVTLTGDSNGLPINEELRWRERVQADPAHEDRKRVTEEGAEAIALGLAGLHRSLRVRRRLQQQYAEGADWLLLDPATGSKVVLEVSGTDGGNLDALLTRKIAQAKQSIFAVRGRPAACVVRFAEPRARFWCDDEAR
jgi:hypothetical protein